MWESLLFRIHRPNEDGRQTEKLVLEIEKNLILYDKEKRDYKDAAKKDDVWDVIAKRVGLKDVAEFVFSLLNVSQGIFPTRL